MMLLIQPGCAGDCPEKAMSTAGSFSNWLCNCVKNNSSSSSFVPSGAVSSEEVTRHRPLTLQHGSLLGTGGPLMGFLSRGSQGASQPAVCPRQSVPVLSDSLVILQPDRRIASYLVYCHAAVRGAPGSVVNLPVHVPSTMALGVNRDHVPHVDHHHYHHLL